MTASLEERLKALDEAREKLIHQAFDDKEKEINELMREAMQKMEAEIMKEKDNESEQDS